MATNLSAQFASDYENVILDGLIPLTQNRLVAYNLGEKIIMPKGHGLSISKVRFNRLPLPGGPLVEPTPSTGATMGISMVTATCQQWGGLVSLSDVAAISIKHDVLARARELVSIQIVELLERNTMNTLLGFTQVNTVNSRGSRGAIVASDYLGIFDIERTQAQMSYLGAYYWDGTEQVNPELDAHADAVEKARQLPSPYLILLVHDFVAADLRLNAQFVRASSFSDVNKIYTTEVGQLAGSRVVKSNMVPFFVGEAALTGTASTTGGSLASGNYVIQVTESDPMRLYEQNIHQASAPIAVTGPTGSISVVLPVSAFLFNVYISLAGNPSPVNLALTSATTPPGLLSGQAAQLAGGQTVVLTGIGAAQVPPAAPATGVTVYPSFFIGKHAYSQVVLDDVEIHVLTGPEKFDPQDQLREVAWKVFYATLPENNLFVVRIESASAFTNTFA